MLKTKRISKRIFSTLSMGVSLTDFVHPIIQKIASPLKHNKYGRMIIQYKGERFDSLSEYIRWQFLKLHEKDGEITNLRRQVIYPLKAPKFRYTADFVYVRNNQEIVEDVKSPRLEFSPSFVLVKKLMHEQYNIIISVVSPRRLYKWIL